MAAPAPRRMVAADSFDRLADVVGGLRARGYTRLGGWSLPQACYHLSAAMESALVRPETTDQTPGQAAAWQQYLAAVTSPAGIPPGNPLPGPAFDPPADCGDDQIDRLIDAGRAMATWPHSHLTSRRFGPVPVDQGRRFHLAHANHHLSFLQPKPTGRARLEYPDVDAALADVSRLRQGYAKTGQWTLAQVAYHVAASLGERMRPEAADDPDTPGQRLRHGIRDRVLAENTIMAGLTSPPASTPPPDLADDTDAGRAAIDGLVAQLGLFDRYPGEFPPHRLFGRMTRDQNRRHQLIHAAHHLGHLVPNDQ